MRELLKEHINVISIENCASCEFCDRYLSELSQHKHLSLTDITNDIKNRGLYTSVVAMSDATIELSITGHCDYLTMIDNIVISYNSDNDINKNEIENCFGLPIERVLEHLTIKYIFKEDNSRLIDILNKENRKTSSEFESFCVTHSLNNPSFAYKGQVLFEKSTAETRKSVAKSWFLIEADEVLTHEGSYKNVWLAIKVIILRKGVSKTFYKISEDSHEIVEWLSTPLALRDPSLLKMVFDIRSSAASSNPVLLKALDALGPVDYNPPDVIDSKTNPNNLVSLSAIKERFQDAVSESSPFSITQKQSLIGSQGINPYTSTNPRELLDTNQEHKSIRFETGNLNNRVLKNEPDKYIFDGWLVAYLNSREDKPLDYQEEPKDSGERISLAGWFEIFLFKSDDHYYLTKITRKKNRIRHVDVGKSRKVKNDRNIGSVKTTDHESLEELIKFYKDPKCPNRIASWALDLLEPISI